MIRVFILTVSAFTLFATSFSQITSESIFVNGVSRSYLLYLPDGFMISDALPLVVCFHGGSGTASEQLALGDLRSQADEDGFVLVYPQALPDPNDGGSTNWQVVTSGTLPFTQPNPHSDIEFVSALIQELNVMYGIDQSRVYAMGYSNGGGFVYDLACRLNDQITGIGAVSRTMYVESYANCSVSHPTPVVTILGTSDWNSPYNGLTYNGVLYFQSSDEGNALWIEENGLLNNPEVVAIPNINPNDGSTVDRYRWTDSEDCIELIHYRVNGGDHDWPGTTGNMDIVSHEVIWNHLKAFDMNGKIACANDVSPCDEDVNSDGAVNVADVLSVLSNFGCADSCVADANNDGAVNISDVLILLAAFGVNC